ncbi:MAG: type III-A CRISPR-associated RAMP protein Csm3 [Anaerolineae bacterium]|nr:type III-A CRISPR-associated RAMP protein Csm3 [Anaerolineae bacterium]NUQ04765.1 type III-A CRISPR-associated RAMP protein Csm3 [Anaerolineae bacterium]
MADEPVASIKLYGRIFLTMDIVAVTGLRIGGKPTSLQIGGLENVVLRDPLSQRPYIPGSSLRGKMRSLWEKATNAPQNFYVRRGSPMVRIHTLDDKGILNNDVVCRIFGATGDANPLGVKNPTRLIIHDTFLSDASALELDEAGATDQPYTETKWEAAIDRITSAAVPRQMERVPAGARFTDCKLIYSVFGNRDKNPDQPPLDDIDWFFDIVTMLQLVEDDYLGSSGSRGYGQIAFRNLRLGVRVTGEGDPIRYRDLRNTEVYPTLESFSAALDTLKPDVAQLFR